MIKVNHLAAPFSILKLETYFYSLAFESVWFAFISLAPTTMYLISFLSIPLFIFIHSVFCITLRSVSCV